MKKLKYLLIAILFTAFAGEGFGQGDFLRNYETPNITSNNASDFDASGVMYIPTANHKGYVTVHRKLTNIVLTKTDLFGNVLWCKTITANSSPHISFDSDDATGDVYLSCSINSALNIFKISPSGVVLFKTTFGNSEPDNTKVIIKNLTTYIVTSSRRIGNNFSGDVILTSIDNTGNTIFSDKYEGDFFPSTITQKNDENILLCVSFYANSIMYTNTSAVAWITINPANGLIVNNWKVYETYSTIQAVILTGSTVINPGISEEYLLCGNFYQAKALILTINNNGTFKWQKHFPAIATFNDVISNGNLINAVGIKNNGHAKLYTCTIIPNGVQNVMERDLSIPGVSSNLNVSSTYSFDYGSNGFPILTAEEGYNNLFPLYSFNSLSNPDLTNCQINLNTTTGNSGNQFYLLPNNLSNVSVSENSTSGTGSLIKIVSKSSSSCGSTCTIPYFSTINQLGNVCSTGGGSAILAASVASGGPYNYYWSDGSVGTMTIYNPGTYSVTISDPSTGCTQVQSITVAGDANLSTGYAIDPAGSSTCVNDPTTFNLVPNLNEPNATYSWTSAGGNSNNSTLVATFLSFQTSPVNLTYTNSCGSFNFSTNVSVNGFVVTPTVTQPQCFGNLGSISLNVQPPPGATITYAWSNGASSSSISNLVPNTYTVTVTDGSCSQSFTFTVNAAPSQLVLGSPSITNESCLNANDGQISISATGGTAPYTYNWSDGSTGATNTGMAPVTHSVTVTDANGCTDVASGMTVGQGQTGVTLGTPQFQNSTCYGVCDGTTSITAAIYSSSSTYTYAWSDGVNGTSNNATLTRNNLCANNYTVTVTEANGCSSTAQVTIADGQSLWHKTTQNNTGQNDNIKRVITDADGNVYALGEYKGETILDGEVLNAGGGSSQDGIFLAKYNNCGKLVWYVNSSSAGFNYDLKAIDIAFSGSSDIMIYGKWNGGSNFVEMQNSVGGNPVQRSGSSTNQVFSFSIVKTSAVINVNPKIYKVYFSDEVTKVLTDGTDSYFAGQFSVSGNTTAGIRKGTSGTLSWVFKDHLNGANNVVTGMYMYNGNTYAIANLQSNANFNNNGLITVSSGQKEGVLLKYDGTTVTKNIAKSPNLNLTDIVYNSVTHNVWVTGQFKDNIQNWNANMVSGIQTGLIASFEEANLATINQYYLDPSTGLSTASANAITIKGNNIYVAGTFTGSIIELGMFNNSQVHSNYVGSGFTNNLWMAKYNVLAGTFMWVEGSHSTDPITVNDIAYDGTNAYIGGGYKMDISLPNVPRPHPFGGGSNIELGYIIRGGDFPSAGAQGAYYKTNTNSGNATQVDKIDTKARFSIYPNPNNGAFTVRLVGENTGVAHLTIYDVTGRVVYNQTTEKTTKTYEFSLISQGLSKGIYMLGVELNGITKYQKFMIQ